MTSLATPTTLNLGAGREYMQGAVNLDITPDTRPDVVHDLNVTPWPFGDDTFEEVTAHDVIEHLDDVLRTMEELHRICRHGAHINITVPHFSSSNAFTDPTHRRALGAFSFDYFTGRALHSYYTRVRFRLVSRAIIFRWTPVNRAIGRLANRWPDRWERRWAWLFPAVFISFRLEVLKDEVSPRADSSQGG